MGSYINNMAELMGWSYYGPLSLVSQKGTTPMGAKKAGKQHERVLTQNNSGSYQLTVPIELIRNMNWKKGQRVTIKKQVDRLIIEDWKG